jgi:hypothetical protein
MGAGAASWSTRDDKWRTITADADDDVPSPLSREGLIHSGCRRGPSGMDRTHTFQMFSVDIS